MSQYTEWYDAMQPYEPPQPPVQPPPGWAYHPQYGWYQIQPQPQQPQMAVTYHRKDTAHTAHIILSIVTFGAWFIFVYGPLLAIRAMHKQKETTYYQ